MENLEKKSVAGIANAQHTYGATQGLPMSSGAVETHVGCWKRFYPSGFVKELKLVLRLTGPMILTQACQFLIGPVALMFCGHLGEIPLAAVALANSLINVTGLTIALGLACACDTLFAQVYGSRNRRKLGIVLQRSLLILLLAVLPCWAIHLNAEPLLLLLGQDPVVSRVTARYLLIFMPGILFFFIYVCLSKYLQNQNIVIPTLVIGAVSNGLNAILHYLLVVVASMGIEGSAICQVVAYFSMTTLTLLYILVSKIYKETWEGWSLRSLRDWGEFYRLGAFGLVMLCAEYWSFEIGIITAGLLGTSSLSAMSVIFQLETIAYMFPLGTGIAASIRVGQCLGAGDAEGAQTAARVAITFICGVEVILATVFATMRFILPHIFTNVPEVIELVSQVLPVCAVYQLSDGLSGTGAGILRGQGRQNLGAAIVFGGYLTALTVGTPLMLYTSLRLYAFWGGLAVALTVEGVLFALIIHLNDWDNQARLALLRVKVESETNEKDEVEDGIPNEKTALLPGQTDVVAMAARQGRRSNEGHAGDELRISEIIPKRLFTLAIFFAIFLAGIFVRVFYTNTLSVYPTGYEFNRTEQYFTI